MRKPAARLLAAAAALGLLTGCGGGGHASAASGPAAGSSGTPASAASGVHAQAPVVVPMPLDAYRLSNEQVSAEEQLSLFLERSCMRGLGFSDYLSSWSSRDIAQGAATFDEFDSRLWGLSNPAQAARYGYHLPPWVQGTSSPQLIGSLPAKEREALGGCFGWARRTVAATGIGQPGATAPLVGELSTDSFNRTLADPRVRAVFGKWSACMRAAGYAYPTPLSTDFNMNGPPAALEISTAKADMTCKAKTNLLAVAYGVQSSLQRSMIKANAGRLAAIGAQLAQQVKALNRAEAKYGLLA